LGANRSQVADLGALRFRIATGSTLARAARRASYRRRYEIDVAIFQRYFALNWFRRPDGKPY